MSHLSIEIGRMGEGKNELVRSLGHTRRHDLLSPSTSEQALSDIYHHTNQVPLWYKTLFPIVPQPFTTIEDDEDTTQSSPIPISPSCPTTASLFPTPESVRIFITKQTTRLNLLQHIRHQLIGMGEKQQRAHKKYAELHLDVKLLFALSDLFAFSTSTLELVHHSTSTELTTLQHNNLLIMNDILQVLCHMMQTDELQLDLHSVTPEGVCRDLPPPQLRLNIADRLSAHNSAEILLTMFETLMDELNSHPDSSDSTSSSDITLKLTLLESILRCLNTQLELCTPESVHRTNILKQLYLFIPSHLQSQPISSHTISPGAGSDSEIIRLLISLVQQHRTDSLTIQSSNLLTHIALTPITNDHVHSSDCKKPPSPDSCTKGVPPSPVITYPAYSNSILAVASTLFLFPHNPALYLIEKGYLICAYLDILQPYLPKPNIVPLNALMMGTGSPKTTPKLSARSLFRQESNQQLDINLTSIDDELDNFRLSPVPTSPPNPARCHQSFTHEPHLHPSTEQGEYAHHAASVLSEHRFMLDSYARSEPITNEPNSTMVQHPLQPPSLERTHSSSSMTSDTPQQHRPASLWQSNEVLAAALHGLSALCTNNTIVSLHLCQQPGLLNFLSDLLSHKDIKFNLLAANLLGRIERALESAPHCSVIGCTSLAHTDSPSLTQYLSALTKPRALSRRNSSAGVGSKHHRRNSLGNPHSPHHSVPNSPAQKPLHSATFSPKVMGLSGSIASPLPTILSRTEAHALVVPLVIRSIRFLLGRMRLQWPSLRSKAPKVGLDLPTQKQLIDTLSGLVAHSSVFQSEASEAITILATLLVQPTQMPSMRQACLTCVANLCSLYAPNRPLVIESKLLSHVVMPTLAVLKPFDTRRRKDTNSLIHPSVVALQLACVNLCANLSESFAYLASEQLAEVSEAASSTAMGNLLLEFLSFLDHCDTPLTLRVATSTLIRHLLTEQSPLRELLFKAEIVPKLVKLSVDEGLDGVDSIGCCQLNSSASEHCHSTPTLATQLRYNAFGGLANITTNSKLPVKQLVLSELSLDGLLNLIETTNEFRTAASSSKSTIALDQTIQLEKCGWTILRNLFEQSHEFDVDAPAPTPPGEPTISQQQPNELFSHYDIMRVLDLLIKHLQPTTNSTSQEDDSNRAELLATIAARMDVSKSIICSRPSLLSYLYGELLNQTGEKLKRAAHSIIYLLQPTSDELKQSGSFEVRSPNDDIVTVNSDSFIKRMQLIFEHDLLSTFIVLGTDPIEPSSPIASPTNQRRTVTYYIRRRIKLALISMHGLLKSSEANQTHAHWRLLDDYVAAAQQQQLASTSVTTDSLTTPRAEHPSSYHPPIINTTRGPPRRIGRRALRNYHLTYGYPPSNSVVHFNDCDEIEEESHEIEESIDQILEEVEQEDGSDPDIYASSSSSSSSSSDDSVDSAELTAADWSMRLAERLSRDEEEHRTNEPHDDEKHVTPTEPSITNSRRSVNTNSSLRAGRRAEAALEIQTLRESQEVANRIIRTIESRLRSQPIQIITTRMMQRPIQTPPPNRRRH